MKKFGTFVRQRRESLRLEDPRFSVRQLAARIGVEPSYLSKIERELEAPPSEAKIRALARELGEDPDSLLARAGKVAADLQRTICRRPQLFSQLIRELDDQPDRALVRLTRTVRIGKSKGELQ